jgi:hypothetical protein
MRTSPTIYDLLESPTDMVETSTPEPKHSGTGKPSIWKRFFGGASQSTPKTVEKESVPEEPAAAASPDAVASAELAPVDSCAPSQPAEAPFETERQISMTQADASVSQESPAPAISDEKAADDSGGVMLHITASLGQVEATAQLLAQGADVSAMDHHGRTPLHRAVLCGSKEVSELLLSHGANANARNTFGLTPLHTAARFGMKELADLLVAHGANVNLADNFGDTPLRSAIERSQDEIAELLRRNGADEPTAAPDQAPPGALIQFEAVEVPAEKPAAIEAEAKGEAPQQPAEMSREEIRNQRLARKRAAREAKRAQAHERDSHTAIAA